MYMQPALPEPAIALALPLVERQLQQYGDQLALATAILGFLSRLASTAKLRQSREFGAGTGAEEEEEEVYTAEQVQLNIGSSLMHYFWVGDVLVSQGSCVQAARVLELLSSHNVLRHVMKVPPQVRKDPAFDAHYCLLVKALVPTRKKVATKPPFLSPAAHSASCLTPPAKPKRIRRAATEASLMGSRVSQCGRV